MMESPPWIKENDFLANFRFSSSVLLEIDEKLCFKKYHFETDQQLL